MFGTIPLVAVSFQDGMFVIPATQQEHCARIPIRLERTKIQTEVD
jgi:hypothetical protein